MLVDVTSKELPSLEQPAVLQERLRVGIAPTEGLEDLGRVGAASEGKDRLAEATAHLLHLILVVEPHLLEGCERVR